MRKFKGKKKKVPFSTCKKIYRDSQTPHYGRTTKETNLCFMSVYTLFIMLYLKYTNGTLWITTYKIPSYERGLRAATKKVNDRFFNFLLSRLF